MPKPNLIRVAVIKCLLCYDLGQIIDPFDQGKRRPCPCLGGVSHVSKFRGHCIELAEGGDWVYSDTKEPVNDCHLVRSCGNCNKHYTKEGHDGCLGQLNGIMNACCGHGEPEEAYVQFLDGFCIRGEDAKMILEISKKWAAQAVPVPERYLAVEQVTAGRRLALKILRKRSGQVGPMKKIGRAPAFGEN